MKKFNKYLIMASCLFAMTYLTSSCNDENDSNTSQDVFESKYSVNGLDTLKQNYTIDEIIDLKGLEIIEIKSDKTNKTISIYDDDVRVEGADTSKIGEYTLVIYYKNIEVLKHNYNVNEYTLTLNYGDGNVDGKEKDTITASNGEYCLEGINPVANDENKVFAGWFLDEQLTKRVTYTTDKYISAEGVSQIYAGYDVDYQGLFTYEIDYEQNTAKITAVDAFSPVFETLEELVIPSTLELYPVVELGDELFTVYSDETDDEGFNIGSILVNLKKLSFAENSYVKMIGNSAFKEMHFEEINLPESLVNIGCCCFENCFELKEITIPQRVERIEKDAFSSGVSITKINFSDYGALRFIGEGAFEFNDNITEVRLPKGLEQLMPFAFNSCEKLEKVYIPESLYSIGLHAFKDDQRLKSITVDDKNTVYCSVNGDLYSKDMTSIYRYCYGKYEEKFVMPNTVTSIEESAFNVEYGYNVLTEIVLSSNLSTIHDDAFAGCSAYMELPESLKTITDKAFYHYYCAKYTLASTNPYFSTDKYGILYSKDYSTLYSVPRNIDLSTFVLDNRVTTIKSYAIVKNENIRSIRISNLSKLTKIEEYGIALNSLENLNSLIIEKTELIDLMNNCFYLKIDLENIKFFIVLTNDNYDTYYESVYNQLLPFYEYYSEDEQKNKIDSVIEKDQDSITDSINEIAKTSFTNYTLFEKGVSCYFKDDYKTTAKYKIEKVVGLNEVIYNNFYSLLSEDEIKYFKEFEKNFYIEAYDMLSDSNIIWDAINISILNNAIKHFGFLPASIQNVVKPYYDKITPIKTSVDNVTVMRKNISKRIMNFTFTNNSFNKEDYLSLVNDIEKYKYFYVSVPTVINEKFNIIECSYLLFEFINLKGNYANSLDDAHLYLNGDQSVYGDFGIEHYLNVFSASIKASLYGIDLFDECKMEYLEEAAKNDKKLLNELKNFDFTSEYNAITYEAVSNNIYQLSANCEYDSSYIDIQNSINLIHDIHSYLDTYQEINDSNYVKANEDGQNISYIIDSVQGFINNYENLTNLVALYNTKYLEANTYLTNKYVKLRNLLDAFDVEKEFDMTAYNEIISLCNELGSLQNAIDYYDGNYSDYSSKITLINLAYRMYMLTTKYQTVTADNYREIEEMIYSYYNKEDNYFYDGINDVINYLSYSAYDYTKIYYYNSYDNLKELFDNF